MTVTPPPTPATAPVPPAPPGNPASAARREAWTLSLPGVWLVAQLELRQRVRSTKWKWALATVAVLIGGITFLIWGALHAFSGNDNSGSGAIIFGLVVFFVLFLGLVISPTLSATTINGDVRDGTLAPLQATGLSSIDIVLGKLLASWIASLAFLVVAIPFLVFAYADGGTPALAMITVTLVLAAELLVVCALGLGWSAITARTPSSAVLTFTTVAVITVVLPILFGLLTAVFTEERTVTERYEVYYDESSAPPGAEQDGFGGYYVCEEQTYTNTVARTDRLWWLLAVNPYVVVADSAPSPRSTDDFYTEEGPLQALKDAVREARLGPRTENNYCGGEITEQERERQEDLGALPPVWPWGLAGQALLGFGAVALAVRRVTVPYGKLPTGSRVA